MRGRGKINVKRPGGGWVGASILQKDRKKAAFFSDGVSGGGEGLGCGGGGGSYCRKKDSVWGGPGVKSVKKTNPTWGGRGRTGEELCAGGGGKGHK